MKIAAYQAPLFENGSLAAFELLCTQVAVCEEAGVEILCFPEAVLGGLADYYDRPSAYALNVENGQLQKFLSPLTSRTVSTIVGSTEMTDAGTLYNTAAIFHHGEVLGLYRKVYPAENHSVYGAGTELPTFTIGSLTFGVIICNDTNYYEPARGSILGPQLATRTWDGQQTEARIGCSILNQMVHLGKPESYRVELNS